jgi:anti-anti-sigma regulatory factor
MYRAPKRPSVLYVVVHGDIRADEFDDDLGRIEAKRPLRVVLDLTHATSIEASAVDAVLGLKRRLAADGALLQVIAGPKFAAELTVLGEAHLIHEEPSHARPNPSLRARSDPSRLGSSAGKRRG